jgi:enamine deaminase RidA (YjgF/YER057c/UK114 family)
VIEQPTMRRRLALLGLRLPEVKPPAFHYVPVVAHGGIAYVSGQLPWLDGEIRPAGKVEREVSLELAEEAARRCVLQALAWLNQALAGGLDEIERALRVTGYVASSPGFDQQPKVIDAASEILVKLFGHAGHHARSAIGVAELPRNAPVEIEFIFAIKRRPNIAQRQRRPGFPVVEKRP